MTPHCIHHLIENGITHTDALALRRIAMQLHRWHERECGSDSGCIERDETTGKCFWLNAYTGNRYPVRDMETPALKRLAKIMKNYPSMRSYIQGDPRGAPLYILRSGDVPEGGDDDAYYNHGIAVYK